MSILVAITVLLIAIGGLITTFSQGAKGLRNVFIQGKFVELGTIKGKTKAEITARVGEPTHVSYQTDGKALLQWITANYHIALIFDGDICGGITHESTSR